MTRLCQILPWDTVRSDPPEAIRLSPKYDRKSRESSRFLLFLRQLYTCGKESYNETTRCKVGVFHCKPRKSGLQLPFADKEVFLLI